MTQVIKGKNVFITGGTTGIGLELAKYYRSLGNTVGVCGRDLTKLEDTNFDAYAVDVTVEDKIKEAINQFRQKNGPVDIVIANAGIGMSIKDGSANFALARKIMNINVIGVINTFEAAMENFPNSGGQLVAISSVAAYSGLPGIGPYSASKAAVFKLCESYNIDWAHRNISVTAVCPGFIDTPLTQQNNHAMPFLMSADVAAKKIYNAVAAKKALFVFPWQMGFLMRFSEIVPRFIYRSIIRWGIKIVLSGR